MKFIWTMPIFKSFILVLKKIIEPLGTSMHEKLPLLFLVKHNRLCCYTFKQNVKWIFEKMRVFDWEMLFLIS